MRNSKRLTLPLLALALIGLVAVPAARALVGSVFEASDGDLTSASGLDWDGIAGMLEVGYDEPTGQTDDSLGGKEDDPEPSVDFGSIPNNKSDLLRFYVHHESVEVGDGSERDYLYLAWVRANTLGTANMDFEFNQADQLSANGRTPVRRDGDMLVTFGFSAGGNVVELGLSMWTGIGPCEASPAPPCWGPRMPLAGVAEGAVNFTDVFDPVTGATLADRTFGEAAIDLTGAGVFDRDECVSFGSAYVKSRSSDSFTSAMKDFIRPISVSVTNCATVTVRKNAVPDDAQEFSFTPSADLALVDVILDDDPSSTLPSSHSFVGRFEGTQTILEQPVPGWDLTGLSCVGAGEPERDETGALTGLVSILAATGETVDCTWVNTKRGRLVVDQVTLPGGDPQSFGFALVGGPEALASAFALTGSDSPWDSGPVRPGTYALSQQDDGPEWDLASSVCSDGSPASAVVVDPGETVTCTFTNVKRGVLIVDEVTLPADDPQMFSFALSGGPDAISQAFALADASTPHASGFARSGTYAVAQQDDGPEWDLASSVCSDGSPAGAVALSPGETVTCAFTNVRRGSITVDVMTTPSGDPQAFSFVLSGGPDAVNQAFGLADASTPHASGLVKPGSYAVAAAPAGAEWDLVSSSCTNGSVPGSIGLAAGESLTCTFHYVKRGTIRVDVVTTPSGDPQAFSFVLSGGPDAVSQAFALADASTPHASGFVKPGSYAVAAAPAGAEWDLVSSSCTDGSVPGSIGLAAGESLTCTFHYVKRGTIRVDVVTTPSGDPQAFSFVLSGGPDAVSQAFGLADASTPHASGLVKPGSYAVAAAPAGAEWDLVSSSCTDGSVPGSIGLAAGESLTCTFHYVKRGTIRVDVVTTPSGDPQAFSFVLSGGPDAVSQAFGLADASAPHASGLVKPGSYAVAAAPAGAEWDLVSSSCTDGSVPGSIGLAAGESLTCTFHYVKRGTIRVDVVTTPSGDPQAFSFVLSGGPDAVSQAFALADASTPHASGFVKPGSYAVAAAPAGAEWDLVSSSCTDGSVPGSIGLAAGESLTCTFHYVKRGTIRVDVVTTPSGDPQAFSFVLSGGPDAVSQAFGLADASTPHASGLVKPGSYAVAAAPAGAEWDLVSSSCTDGSVPGSIGLAAGESLTCTFHYVKRARVVVAKIVTNEPPAGVTWDPSLHPFSFSAGWGASFTLRHGESETSSWIRSLRDYTISESAPRGWYTTSECVHADGSRVTGGASISVEPQPGEQVACTFFNELRTHPGSSGFWRNWSNHYTTTQFRTILAAALAGSPIYATLFNPYTGALAPDAIGRIDAIYSANGTTAHLLREVTSTLLNLGVSRNPTIEPLQRNDDICLECVLDLDEIPGADAMLRSLAPCELPDRLRIADAVAVAEGAWTGNVATGTWSFGLDASQLGLLDQLFGGINQGSAIVADVTLYPAELTCVSAPGPVTFTWYRDADRDGHGVLSPRTQTCDGTAPSGYAATRNDCDDAADAVWPGASEVCDGVANDCAAPGWPALPASERDNDGDGSSTCGGDCNDGDSQTFPGAVELCDGRATDCLGASWPLPPAWDRDDDGDSVSECNGDCDDGNASVRPGAFELCDGVNNDCTDPAWPAVETFEADADGDGYPACADCNDAAVAIHPGAAEACNGIDDDCSGFADDGPAGLDPDQDGRPSACDNCPLEWNDRQADVDGDGHGDLCDNCREIRNPDQANGDSDSRGDVCDACPFVADVPTEDLDRDRVSDVCDNCFNDPNVSQSDFDQDGEGDACDVNDGAIYLRFASATLLEWDAEAGYASWTCRRGDLQVLKTTGESVQAPGSNDLAEIESGILHPWVIDDDPIPVGRCAFYLIE